MPPLARVVLLALVAAAAAVAVVHGSWIAAQARAVVVLSTTIETPVLSWLVRQLTDEPRLVETTVAGVPTTVARPSAGEGPWPAFVFVNGATHQGRREPNVRALARGLARAGFVVLVPDLPGLADAEVTERTAEATVAVALAAAGRPDVSGSRVALLGVSVGGSLALLAAEDPALADRLSLVAGIAPYADLADVVRVATTGRTALGGEPERYEADPFLGVVVGRSLVASLPPGSDRERLLGALPESHEVPPPDPLGPLRQVPLGALAPPARAVVALLVNRDPARFDPLYAALPASIRSSIARLSPLREAASIHAVVELATAREDKFFPLAHSRALVAAAPSARLTVTSAFAHAVPRPSPTDPVDVLRFDAWAVRNLHAARDDG